MNMTKWEACGDSSLQISDFIGEECWTGADLASKNDLACLAVLFRRRIAGVDHIYQFVRHYLPEQAVIDSANAGHYDGWVRSGYLTVTPGVVLDVDKIEDDVEAINQDHPIRECCFDPMHNATQFGVDLQGKGFNMVEVRPTVANFSEPMKFMEAKVRAGEWHHSCDPCLTWQVSNCEVKLDFKDNIFPRKPDAGQARDRKIDAVVATIIAYNRLLADEAPTVFDRDLIVL